MAINWEEPKYREGIGAILRKSTKQHPATRETIIRELNIMNVTENDKNSLKRCINNWRRGASPEDSLHYLINEGQGYYIPMTEIECNKIEIRAARTVAGVQRWGNRYTVRKKIIREQQPFLQLEIFKEEG